MQRILIIFSIALFFFSCGKENKFTIEGNVENAQGSTLYFEHVGVSKVNLIDSVKLSAKGNFKFKKERLASPEFYRLRLNKQFIDLAIDSTETISIQADSATFAKDYIIEGSENNTKIKELSILRAKTANTLNKLDKSFETKKIGQEEFLDQSLEAIDLYKETAKKFILENPNSTTAYYALMQTINGLMIFDPFEKADNPFFRAVTTQWDFYYPDSKLTRQIKMLSLQGIRALRSEKENPLRFTEEKMINLFDINLPTVSGDNIQLSEITQGKVTLLEFCAYTDPGSPEHNMQLAKIYDQYKNKGFQIFQVSLDTDEHEWKNIAVNLPWMSVRDPQSIYSENIVNYNISEIPTGFIINREGEIVLRVDSFENLESDIRQYLK